MIRMASKKGSKLPRESSKLSAVAVVSADSSTHPSTVLVGINSVTAVLPKNDNSNPQQGDGKSPGPDQTLVTVPFLPKSSLKSTGPLLPACDSGVCAPTSPSLLLLPECETSSARAFLPPPMSTVSPLTGTHRARGNIPQPASTTNNSPESKSHRPINHVKIPATQHDNRKLFVGGLPTNVTESTFLKFFEQFGEVIDSVVMIDRTTKRSRGFGFVTFASETVAQSLLTTNPGRSGMVTISGKICEVKASEPKTDVGSSTQRSNNRSGAGWDQQRRMMGNSQNNNHSSNLKQYSQNNRNQYHMAPMAGQYEREDPRNFDSLSGGSEGGPAPISNEYGQTNFSSVPPPSAYPQSYHQSAMHLPAGPTYSQYTNRSWEAPYPGSSNGSEYVCDYGYGATMMAAGNGDPGTYYAHPSTYQENMYNQMGSYMARPSYPPPYYGAPVPAGMYVHGTYASDGSIESYPPQIYDGVPDNGYEENVTDRVNDVPVIFD